MNFIELDPASLTIGYVCGTLLCWYLRDMLDAKESEYDQEDKEWIVSSGEKYPGNYDSSPYDGNYPYNLPASNGK